MMFGWFRKPKPKLKWKVQYHVRQPDPCTNLIHYAHTSDGVFEIYEDDEPTCLMLFPNAMKRPCEIFESVVEAKKAALLAIQ